MILTCEVEGFGAPVAFLDDTREWAVARGSVLLLYRDGREVARVAAPGKIFALQLDASRRRLLAAPHVYLPATGQFTELPPFDGDDYEVRAAAWSPDGEDLVAALRYLPDDDDDGGEPARERLLRMRGGRPAQILDEGAGEYRALAAGGEWLAAATHRVSVWDRVSGVRRDFAVAGRHAVRALAGDEHTLFGADAVGLAAGWDVRTGALRVSWQAHEADVRSLAHHAGRALLATAGADGTLRLWSVSGPPRLVHEQRLDGVADALAFNSAGDELLVALHDLRPRLLLFRDLDRATAY